MSSITGQINYGKNTISYQLFFMERKSLEIAVHPDKQVIVKAPITASRDDVEKRIKKRTRWIKRQLDYFTQFEPRTSLRRYVSGESHLYMGRSYRLKVYKDRKEKVSLQSGYFQIGTNKELPQHVKKLIDDWYREKALQQLYKIFNASWERFVLRHERLKKPHLTVKKMKKRWGSLTTSGTLILNLDLIRAPKDCIEYVVLHELCHLIHHNHSTEFYRLLEKEMPDWSKRKHKLEISLA